MIKKRSLLDKLGGKTTTQLPAASVNSALGRSVGSYQPSVQPIQQPIIPKPILPPVNLSRPVTRDLGTPSLRESTQRENAKQSIVDAKLEKQTKQNASDRAKMLERQISDKYGIDVKRANSPIEAVNMLSMVDDSQKEQFKKDFAEYSFAAERSNPFRAGAEAGFNILPTNLEKTEGKEEVQTAKGYGAGRLVGGIGQQLAFNSVLGPGIESLTSKLLPKATPFVTETIKDVAIGTGTQLAEAPFDKPTAGQFAGNIALDIALNALFGVVGKGLSKVDLSNLKTAKPSQVVGDVAEKLNVSIVEADKLVDDAIDFYVNQSGVADTKPFDQLQLEAPKNVSSDANAIRLRETSQPKFERQDIKSDIPISERTFKEIGDKKIKAFQYENPEVKPFYTEKANELLIDVRNTAKGEKTYNWNDGDLTVGGMPRTTSPMVAEIKDSTGATYEQIEDSLNRLINDAGQENQALAKRIEVIIDEMLVDGYKRVDGTKVDPNIRYIQTRNRVDTNKIDISQLNAPQASQLNNQLSIGGLDENGQKNLFDADMQRTDFDDFMDAIDKTPTKLSEKVKEATKPQLDRPSDFSVKKPIYPTLDPKFAKERPSVITASDVKRIEPNLNVASKVDQPTTTMKIEPTLKPKKQVEAEAKLKAKQETVSGLSNEKLSDAFSGKISRDVKTKKPSFKQRWEQLKTQFVDDTTPLRRLEEKVKGKLSSAESSIYKQARLFKGAPETANEFIRVRLAPVLTDIEKKGLSTDDLGDYALAVHARDVNNAGINSGFTNEEIEAVIKKFAGNKDMETARKELLKISDDLLEQLSADELIDANQLKALKEKWTNYMPLFRAFDDDKVDFAKGLSDSFSNVTAPIKKLSGSDRNVIDPIESMIKNIYQTTSATMRNRVGLQLTKLAEIDVDNRFIRKLDDKELVGRKNVVNVTENGKKVAYEVDPEVFKTFNNLDKETSSKIIEWLAKPASVLRAGATLTPEFAIRNPFRDIQTAFVNSESGFTPLDFVRGLASTIKKDELYSQFLKEGGGYGGIFSVDRNSSNKILKDILKTPVTDKFVNVVSGKALIRLLRAISDTTESATKVGEFGAALRSGATPSEAAYRAKDMMDFARAGSSIRQWNRITAFMNASIQGKSRLLRSIKERPVGTMMKMTTTMTLPTLGIYVANERLANEKQRQIIDEAPDWLKNTFWLAAIPGTDLVARIPKPFDMSIFANGTERFLDYLKKNDKEAFDGFIRQSIKDQSIPVMITGLAPFLEVMSNYSQFRQSPIIPLREQYVKKEDQYDNTTSELSKLLASGARKVLGEESNFGSPRAMDYALKTSTGGLGTTILDASDWVASSLGISDRPSRAEKGITNAPGLKGFLVSETLSAKSVGDVYDLADKLQREKGSLKLKLQEKYGDRYNADDLKREFKNQEQLTYLNQITDAMSDISKELRATNNSKDMTPQEKRKAIEELTTERNNLAVEAMKEIKEMGK